MFTAAKSGCQRMVGGSAFIGVGVRRWVTYHGFALNVDPDLSYFADIVPCGLSGVRMTSMAEELFCCRYDDGEGPPRKMFRVVWL
jgi:hypothetical protein